MSGLKLMTAWVRPVGEGSLPEAGRVLEGLIYGFYQTFPEYAGYLRFSQSPRAPRYVFVYVVDGCSGLLPQAGEYLHGLLGALFPQAEVRVYGKVWAEV